VLAQALDERDARAAEYQAKYGHHLRLAVPVFNYGTPKTWAMYRAIADHPIWKRMQAAGDVLTCHEGIGFNQSFDYGENQPVEPGAPHADGAGLVNFRIFNLLWLLEQRGITLDWCVTEWYDGRKPRGADIEARVDNLIRHDTLLAASPFSRTCLGYCTFELTDDPGSPWYPQDFTLIWQHPRWQAHVLAVANRQNGVTDMPITISDADWATLTGIVAKYQPAAWKVGDVALAAADPLLCFNEPAGRQVKSLHATWEIDISAVSADGAWLRVSADLWCRAADLKHK